MKEKVDRDIGRVVGFEVDEFMYIATIISIDDVAEQFTVRTEDGQELTGPFDAVFLDPEKRMDELHANYEPIGEGKFRAKQPSNWTPVKDPSLREITQTAGGIIGFALIVMAMITVFSIGAILTQIDSENWVETQGEVVDAYNGQDCSTDSDGTTSCNSYTAVTVTYKYEGRKYSTQTYTMLSDDWMRDADHWLEKGNVTVYVNPDQPSQAVHLQGWDGVMEGVYVAFFFTGLVLGGYLFVFVPVWFVYAKIQRLSGIEAPGDKQKKKNMQTSEETDDNSKAEDTEPDKDDTPSESTAKESTVEETKQEAKFW